MKTVSAVFALLATSVSGRPPSANLPCRPMEEYMPPAVSKAYDIKKHNGTWYEVVFRDLYPKGPLCFCQQSIKYINEEKGYIDDYFVFQCGPGYPRQAASYISPQRENFTNAATGQKHQNGAYDQYVAHSAFKLVTEYEWNAQVVGFKDDGGDQYKWIIEFQCGTRPHLPKYLCAIEGLASDGNCYFTGIQMYVRDLEFREEGYREMVEYVRSLGPSSSLSREIAFVMDDFSGGTWPPYFWNVSWDHLEGEHQCTFPCKSGCFNETTQMWGCCMDQPGIKVTSPFEVDDELVV